MTKYSKDLEHLFSRVYPACANLVPEKTWMNVISQAESVELFPDILQEEAVDLIKRNTRKFARKQLTWFRKGNRYQWFLPDQAEQIAQWVEQQ